MIQLVFGEKGSGKTKKILEIANQAAEQARGSVVFIDEDERYMFDLNLSIRFINASEYVLSGPKMFYGFLCGISASDHDLECIVIDSFMHLVQPCDQTGYFSFMCTGTAARFPENVYCIKD